MQPYFYAGWFVGYAGDFIILEQKDDAIRNWISSSL